MKVGNWKYKQNNETLICQFSPHKNDWYEIDLEIMTISEWLEQIEGKRWCNDIIINDYYLILGEIQKIKPELPIFINIIPDRLKK